MSQQSPTARKNTTQALIGMEADLHMHSTASDGRLDPADVVRTAVENGAGIVALTDHDTTAGLADARRAAESMGAFFITGVEISARQGPEIHMLAYGFQEDHEAIRTLLADQQRARTDRGREFLEVLTAAGALPDSAALDIPPDTSLTRPHIADLLVEHGTVSSRSEAFGRYLTPGVATFVPKPMPSGVHVIETVREAGGITSLAHPGHAVPHHVVKTLISAGLDAIEVVHPAHDEMLETYYRTLAGKHGLLCTGGSDFHAHDGRTGRHIGSMGFQMDEELLHRLRTLPDH